MKAGSVLRNAVVSTTLDPRRSSMSSRPSTPHAQTDPSISDTERDWVVTAYALAVGGYSCSEK